jgi:molecular chaperone GrpE
VTDSPTPPRPEQGQEEEENGRPTVRDKRRIDPTTYQLRDPSAGAAPAGGPSTSSGNADAPAAAAHADGQAEVPSGEAEEIEKLKQQLDDRTSDLQRVQAEYVNYKRRVDRDRDLARAGGIESVLRELLPILDSLKAAREHEELTGGFKGVADEVERLATRHGLESFGAPGDPFDPRIHEALMHGPAPDGITGPTCVTILQPGYKLKDRVIRPARVAVAEPSDQRATASNASEASEEAVRDDSSDSSDGTGAGPQQ